MSNRIQSIWDHPVYQHEFRQIQKIEMDRVYCRHTPEHFLDVARIMWIETLEKDLSYPKDTIYAAALLHDIGRARQAGEGIPHDEASCELARRILPDCGFTEKETEAICQTILGHRRKTGKDNGNSLGDLLRRADKKSRLCFLCKARASCNWPEERKNQKLPVD
ncbi:MAG: HD domain-containing protein [Lachnospiraceae bacterium]|nr:HD domain-containing protein [Lachnospiraceae bacterium]